MIVPGSLFHTDHPFSWYAIVEDQNGHRWTYWFNGTQVSRELVAAHISQHYHAVKVITIDPCTAAPTRPLRPVPPEHYEFGIRKMIEEPALVRAKRIRREPISRNSILKG